jgi:hypothetical protein
VDEANKVIQYDQRMETWFNENGALYIKELSMDGVPDIDALAKDLAWGAQAIRDRSFKQKWPTYEARRIALLRLVEGMLYQLQTDQEVNLSDLRTVERDIEKTSLEDETLDNFLARTQRAIAEWELTPLNGETYMPRRAMEYARSEEGKRRLAEIKAEFAERITVDDRETVTARVVVVDDAAIPALDQMADEGRATKGEVQPGETLQDAIARTLRERA